MRLDHVPEDPTFQHLLPLQIFNGRTTRANISNHSIMFQQHKWTIIPSSFLGTTQGIQASRIRKILSTFSFTRHPPLTVPTSTTLHTRRHLHNAPALPLSSPLISDRSSCTPTDRSKAGPNGTHACALRQDTTPCFPIPSSEFFQFPHTNRFGRKRERERYIPRYLRLWAMNPTSSLSAIL